MLALLACDKLWQYSPTNQNRWWIGHLISRSGWDSCSLFWIVLFQASCRVVDLPQLMNKIF